MQEAVSERGGYEFGTARCMRLCACSCEEMLVARLNQGSEELIDHEIQNFKFQLVKTKSVVHFYCHVYGQTTLNINFMSFQTNSAGPVTLPYLPRKTVAFSNNYIPESTVPHCASQIAFPERVGCHLTNMVSLISWTQPRHHNPFIYSLS